MTRPAYILVNPYCHQGGGWKRWVSIRSQVLEQLPQAREIVSEKGFDVNDAISGLVQRGENTIIISAGGDGSIHTLGNIILTRPADERKNISIGAIGLGSSNDFLKPFTKFIRNIPVRIDTSNEGFFQDVGKVKYTNGKDGLKEKFFIINASFGATAEGNWNFNHPGPLLRLLKRTSTGAAISYTAFKTILTYKNNPATIRFNDKERKVDISNINILKIPYVSGTLHYNQPVLPDDGRLGLNICYGMNKKELLKTLLNLEKGRFAEDAHRISTFTDHFELRSDSPVVFECDGETEKATYVEISVCHKAIQLLGN